MSHFKTYECKVTRLDLVEKAVLEMGFGVQHNTTIKDWASQTRAVALGVTKDNKLLPLGFSVDKDASGNQVINTWSDWYKVPMSEKAFTNKVSQLHDKYVALETCEAAGWNVDMDSMTTNQETGEIEFLATSWA